MSPVRIVFLTATFAALAAPLAGHAAPSTVVAADCSARMTLSERRVAEHSHAGAPALISYVHLTQPIYQVTVDEAFAMVAAQRTRQAQCAVASSR